MKNSNKNPNNFEYNFKVNSAELEGYKLTIGKKSTRNVNFKNQVIDSAPEMSERMNSSSLNKKEFDQISDWSHQYWHQADEGDITNLEKYESDLKRAVYEATTNVMMKWDDIYKKELKKLCKK